MLGSRTGGHPGPCGPSRRSRIGGMIGGVVGGCGWAIGLGILAASAGAWSAVQPTVLAGLLLSTGLGLLLCLLAELGLRVFGPGTRWWFVAFAGGLAVVLGTLLLVANHWVAPLIGRTPALRDHPWVTGDMRTADWVPPVVLAAGIGALAASLVRVVREPVVPSDGTPPP